MTRTLLVLVLLVTAACKKNDESRAAKATEAPTSEPRRRAHVGIPEDNAAGTPVVLDAPALFAAYHQPGQDRVARLEKWRGGTVVTGTVTKFLTDEAGTWSVWLDGGDHHAVTLAFTDDGKAVRAKAIAAGDTITARCKIGGSDGTNLMLTDCVLKAPHD